MIKILIDSASDIDLQEAKSLGIDMIPMQIRFGEEEFLDGVNLSHRDFFEKLIEKGEIPKTSQINEFRFEERFKELTADGDELIVITMSSKLSGTYGCAVDAAKKFKGKVRVIDSMNVCVGERVLCNYALRLIGQGLTSEEIVRELEARKNKIQLLAVLDTLKFLRKGGRISSVAAFAGEMLSIKPVVGIIGGEVKLVGKAIGSKKSNNLLNQLVEKCGGIDFSMPYALGYSGLTDEYLKKYITDSESLWKGRADGLPTCMIGSTIGTHIGPGGIAVSFFGKN